MSLVKEFAETEKKAVDSMENLAKVWVDKYHFAPQKQLTCYDVVLLLEKLELLEKPLIKSV